MTLSHYMIDDDDEPEPYVPEYVITFIKAVHRTRDAKSFAVATSRYPLTGLPPEIAGPITVRDKHGVPHKRKSRVAEYLAGSRKRRRKTHRKGSRG